MASVSLDNIEKSFGAVRVLKGISIDIEDGEFLTLVGPSGCGKTTLLRIIAGLEEQSSGEVLIDGESVSDQPPKARDVAMVFQSYALYPHLSVAENMAVPLVMRRLNAWQRLPVVGRYVPVAEDLRNEIDKTVEQVAESLDIGHLLDRKPAELSGGQRQRVAVGRAIVRRPKVFLMDEPLSNLDAKLRVQMRAEIAQLHRRLGVTFIYVTHDQAEAMTMSDRVAMIMEGNLLQLAPPEEIYGNPQHLKVAEFIGSPKINVITASADAGGEIESLGVKLPLRSNLPSGTKLKIGVRPEALRLSDGAEGSHWTAVVRHVEYLGADVMVFTEIAGVAEPVIIRLDPQLIRTPEVGAAIAVEPVVERVLLFDEEGARVGVVSSIVQEVARG